MTTQSESDAPASPDLASLSDTAKLAAGGIGVLTAVATLAGGFTGGIARVSRNDPSVLPIAVTLVFVALAASLGALLLTKVKPNGVNTIGTSIALILVSLFMFGAATVVTISALSNSLASPDRPIISAKWSKVDGNLVLSGTVSASGMKLDDQLTVVAVRLVDEPVDNSPPPTIPSERSSWEPALHFVTSAGIVYQQTAGADMDGKSSISFEVPLPRGYDGMQLVASTSNLLGCPAQGDVDPIR